MKTKPKKCKRCGKEVDMPFHTCGPRKKLALVCAGVTKADLPVAGMTVKKVRRIVEDWLDHMQHPSRVKPVVNGIPVGEEHVIEPEDRLDFVMTYGTKEYVGSPRESSKPDPIQLGEELAVFMRDKTVLWQRDSLSWQDSPEAESVLRIIWERDFWRDKALNP